MTHRFHPPKRPRGIRGAGHTHMGVQVGATYAATRNKSARCGDAGARARRHHLAPRPAPGMRAAGARRGAGPGAVPGAAAPRLAEDPARSSPRRNPASRALVATDNRRDDASTTLGQAGRANRGRVGQATRWGSWQPCRVCAPAHAGTSAWGESSGVPRVAPAPGGHRRPSRPSGGHSPVAWCGVSWATGSGARSKPVVTAMPVASIAVLDRELVADLRDQRQPETVGLAAQRLQRAAISAASLRSARL